MIDIKKYWDSFEKNVSSNLIITKVKNTEGKNTILVETELNIRFGYMEKTPTVEVELWPNPDKKEVAFSISPLPLTEDIIARDMTKDRFRIFDKLDRDINKMLVKFREEQHPSTSIFLGTFKY